jgi:tetratricopeptide (TPR) repeat protein
MKKILIASCLLTLICCQSPKTNLPTSEVRTLIEKDITKLQKTLKDLEVSEDKNAEWYESDKLFYQYLLDGAKQELDKNYKGAIDYYEKAMNITRYEMSSYEAKLPLGRSYLENGDLLKAKSTLNEFIEEAERELTNDDAEWGLSEEGEKNLKEEISTCKQLLGYIK